MSRVTATIVWLLSVTAVVVMVQETNAGPPASGSLNSAITAPKIPGLEVKVGQTVLIQPNAIYPNAFRFADGRISVGWAVKDPNWHYNDRAGRWSSDGGHTWSDGPCPPTTMSIELGGNEVLSLPYSIPVVKRSDGKYTMPIRRSLDGWKTVTQETAVLDIPRSVPCSGDDGIMGSGFYPDHAILQLRDGRLMATAYGNYDTDKTPSDGFPASYHFRKYRSIALFSSDKGRTWGNPVTVATCADVAVTQEGPDEPRLVRAANGDILCVMRSGGTLAFGPPTPLYCSRSTDEGQTWSKPQAILDRGTWPNVCVMRSGIIVCTTSRRGNWLLFSQDNGNHWKGAFQFDPGDSYNCVIEVAPDTVLVIYDPPAGNIMGTFFTVRAVPESGHAP
jgi:hypothetical protein